VDDLDKTKPAQPTPDAADGTDASVEANAEGVTELPDNTAATGDSDQAQPNDDIAGQIPILDFDLQTGQVREVGSEALPGLLSDFLNGVDGRGISGEQPVGTEVEQPLPSPNNVE
ncbi:MAG: hypothetical protein ACR2Q4_01180, partial [Geminicoccaceae bacterium]